MVKVPNQKEREGMFFDSVASIVQIEKAKDEFFEPLCEKFPCMLMCEHRSHQHSVPSHCARAPKPVMNEPGVEIPVKDVGGNKVRVGTVEIRGRRMDAKYAGPCKFFLRQENFRLTGWDDRQQKPKEASDEK